MAEVDTNIPTLTNIEHQGNEDMLNHFDAHQFDEIETEAASPFTTDDIDSVEFSVDLDSAIEAEQAQPEEVPSITIDDTDALGVDTFSAAISLPENDTAESLLESASTVDDIKLKVKIDQAIADALPGIEAHLKEQLYKNFDL